MGATAVHNSTNAEFPTSYRTHLRSILVSFVDTERSSLKGAKQGIAPFRRAEDAPDTHARTVAHHGIRFSPHMNPQRAKFVH